MVTKIIPQSNLFSTGQEADLLLGLHSSSTTPTGFNYPYRAMSDGQRLFIADTRNNRILIWNSYPTINNQPPDVVVGQNDFTSNYSGSGKCSLNWPVDVFSDGTRLFIADSYNYRILIWNTIPTTNGAPADLVLGQPDFESAGLNATSDSTYIDWPWAVCFDGTRLFVASSGTGRVFVWNSLPTIINQPADYVIGQKDFSYANSESEPKDYNLWTPVEIAVDNGKLMIADYYFNRVLIWNTIPTQSGQPADLVMGQDDFYSRNPSYTRREGLSCKNGKLFISNGIEIRYWNEFPTKNNQPCDMILRPPGDKGYHEPCAKGLHVNYDGQRLTLVDVESNLVNIYNTIPSNPAALPDLVLGKDNYDAETEIWGNKGGWPCFGIASNGKQLMISNGWRLLIYQDLPTEDEAPADNLIGSSNWGEYDNYSIYNNIFRGAWQLSTDGKKLVNIDVLVGIQIWNNIPTQDRVNPDRIICKAGNYSNGVDIRGAMGVWVYKKELYVCDAERRRILMWYDYNTADKHSPDLILSTGSYTPEQITVNEEKIVVGCQFGDTPGAVMIWNKMPNENNKQPDLILTGNPLGFGGVISAFIYDDYLFVSDINNNRVCIYNSIPTNSSEPYNLVLGQKDLTSSLAGKSRIAMTMPAGLWFDGEYLWVGEFKWGNRVLGFKANITPVPPEQPDSISAKVISNNSINLSWIDKANNERGYVLKYKSEFDDDFKIWCYLNSNTTSFDVEGLETNSKYSFYVFCYNSYGESLSSDTLTINLSSLSNNPPTIPFDPIPSDNELIWNVTNLFLGWSCFDNDAGDVIRYNVYLSNRIKPSLVVKNVSSNYYFPQNFSLPENTTFYWKVEAVDMNSEKNESSVWSFHTPNHGDPNTRVRAALDILSSSGGITVPTPGHYSYLKDYYTYLYAVADSNFKFDNWTNQAGIIISSQNPLFIKFDTAKWFKANFSSTNTDINEDSFSELPLNYKLFNCYPNPFNPITTISYSVPRFQLVTLKIYDILGREISTLVNEFKPPGNYKVQFDGRNLSSSVYYYQMIAGKYVETKKLILLK